MIKQTKNLLTLFACLTLVACASTTIYPEGGDKYSLVSTSSSQGTAEKDALKKSQEHCANMGKKLTVLSHNTKYQGADKDNAALIGLAGAVLGAGSNAGHSQDDYQVNMKFKCA